MLWCLNCGSVPLGDYIYVGMGHDIYAHSADIFLIAHSDSGFLATPIHA